MTRLVWVDVAGYVAALLVVGTFYMRTMIPLRSLAVASNVAFIAYGYAQGLYPVLALHLVLLPLNCVRLRQMRALIRRVREASERDRSMDWLVAYMARHVFPPGHVLFRAGDEAASMHLVLRGTVRLTEIGVALGPGAVLGEIGVFAPDNRRTATAVCETEVELGSIGHDTVLQLYFQNPTFGLYLIKLVVQRLLENERRLRARLGSPS
jgi:CRP-like cAMP-binding protein